uniref:Uncharacterized protein n=1 Tax=Aegilops tauschii subsp. strangulata TaxID=200361 RepID=A0A453BGU2_AEGTS
VHIPCGGSTTLSPAAPAVVQSLASALILLTKVGFDPTH